MALCTMYALLEGHGALLSLAHPCDSPMAMHCLQHGTVHSLHQHCFKVFNSAWVVAGLRMLPCCTQCMGCRKTVPGTMISRCQAVHRARCHAVQTVHVINVSHNTVLSQGCALQIVQQRKGEPHGCARRHAMHSARPQRKAPWCAGRHAMRSARRHGAQGGNWTRSKMWAWELPSACIK